MGTVTVTKRGSKFTSSFSALPGHTFGPWTRTEMVLDLTVSALLTAHDARGLVNQATDTGSATVQTGI